jgi:hypothetical protein
MNSRRRPIWRTASTPMAHISKLKQPGGLAGGGQHAQLTPRVSQQQPRRGHVQQLHTAVGQHMQEFDHVKPGHHRVRQLNERLRQQLRIHPAHPLRNSQQVRPARVSVRCLTPGRPSTGLGQDTAAGAARRCHGPARHASITSTRARAQPINALRGGTASQHRRPGGQIHRRCSDPVVWRAKAWTPRPLRHHWNDEPGASPTWWFKLVARGPRADCRSLLHQTVYRCRDAGTCDAGIQPDNPPSYFVRGQRARWRDRGRPRLARHLGCGGRRIRHGSSGKPDDHPHPV